MNDPRRIPLDVCLLNGRAYVQATQILARVGERLDPEGTLLTQAKFARLTQHTLCALPGGPPHDDGDVIGSAKFMRGHEQIDYQFVESQQPAPKQDRRPRVAILALQHDGALSGHFSFTCEATFEGVLDALVQGVKSMHEALGPATSDIWVTGLRNFALPLGVPGFEGSGVARVTKLRLLTNPPRQQSLMSVSLALRGMARPVEGLVSFAFNPGHGLVD